MSKQIEKAQKYIDKAHRLQALDSLDAIRSLAELSRRVPGWLTILTSAVLVILIVLVVFVLGIFLAGGALAILVRGLQGFVILTYPDDKIIWSGFFVLLMAWYLWRNTRWRELLEDTRFDLSPVTLNWLWLGILWPMRILAEMLRLSVALLILTLVLAPIASALTVIVQMAIHWQIFRFTYLNFPVSLAFAAGALYLILGLLRGWRKDTHLRWRPRGTHPTWIQVGMAAGIASLLGGLVAILAPIHKALAGGITGLLYFLLWSCWLTDWQIATPRQLLRRPRLEISLSETQRRFLGFTVFLLWIGGLLVMGYHIADHWFAFRGWLPGAFVDHLRQQLCGNMSSRDCVVLEPWLVGRRMIGYLVLAGGIRLVSLDLVLARPFAWPFFALRAAAETMTIRVRAQLAVYDAIRHHRHRNRELVGRRGRYALCREHLARFKPRYVRMAYGMRWRYWSCRHCNSDVHAMSGVKILRGVFDQEMQTSLKYQGNEIVLVNLLDTTKIPLDLQEIFVIQVNDDHDIENFITHYENFYAAKTIKIPGLHQIRLYLSPEANLGDNQRNMLHSKCRL